VIDTTSIYPRIASLNAQMIQPPPVKPYPLDELSQGIR
jgi:hypothetical protein